MTYYLHKLVESLDRNIRCLDYFMVTQGVTAVLVTETFVSFY